jgi:hypothetical protein
MQPEAALYPAMCSLHLSDVNLQVAIFNRKYEENVD